MMNTAEKWKTTTAILCVFGLFKELRPSEPYVVEYVVDYKNISSETVLHIAWPVSTYTHLGTLVLVFLLTDFLRYRIVVIFEGFLFIATYTILTWGEGLASLLVVEVLYGMCYSTEVAYFSYIYAKVDKENYKKVTSFTYTALIVGKFISGISAQALVSYNLMNLHELNYITLGAECCAFITACFLPKVSHSMYFHRKTATESVKDLETTSEENENISRADLDQQNKVTLRSKIKMAVPILWKDFKSAYSNAYVLKWSIWWSVATAGLYQVINYIQSLWEVISREEGTDQTYNGAVDAIFTTISAILTLAAGFVNILWNKWGEGVLSVISIVQGVLLIWMSQTDRMLIAYAATIIFRVLYQVMITIATAEVVQGINSDSQGLIFGINTFFALLIQTILTVIVVDSAGLALGEREQFYVYGLFFFVLGGFFLIILLRNIFNQYCRNR